MGCGTGADWWQAGDLCCLPALWLDTWLPEGLDSEPLGGAIVLHHLFVAGTAGLPEPWSPGSREA